MSVTPGLYVFRGNASHYIGGHLCSGSVKITPELCADERVINMVNSCEMSYAGPLLAPRRVPVLPAPKRAMPEVKLEAKPEGTKKKIDK